MVVGDALYSAEMVLSDIPQGSCLSLVLFCLFINDLPLVVHHSTVKMIADHVKLDFSPTNSDEAPLLLKDLDAMHNWCTVNSNLSTKINVVIHYFHEVEQSYHYHLIGHSILPMKMSVTLVFIFILVLGLIGMSLK